MIQRLSSNNINATRNVVQNKNNNFSFGATNPVQNQNLTQITKSSVINQPNTTLNPQQQEKYVKLLDVLKSVPQSPNSFGLTPARQLDLLLKNGKLLAQSNHDKSTTLDNLYSMVSTQRVQGLDSITLITNTLDILTNPRIVTQTFGDIPDELRPKIIQHLKDDDAVKQNPSEMDVFSSGTCAAASIEVTMADKYPAEFARWVSELSSPKKQVMLKVKLDSLSKNIPEAVNILNLLQAQKTNFSYQNVDIKVDTDENAYIRAYVQTNHWNKGERNVADVLVQSAIMKLGSQNTYNSLNDTRFGEFNSNPQGLIELEKTFVESLIKNKEITSLVYQKIDDEQNLVGYNCSFDKIQKHILDTIDSGDNVILGYVLTNETSGNTSSREYNPKLHGAKNKVINGHEITIVDYEKDKNGKITFICVDTDDDNQEVIRYSADWLLPKIHHAGYPAHIVQADEAEIMKNMTA